MTVETEKQISQICGNAGTFRSLVEVTCQNPLLGRYVKIQLPRTDYLQLREVKVMGSQ